MRASLRIAFTSLALLIAADAAHAQFRAGYGQRQRIYFQVRSGPYNSFTYAARSYGYAYGSLYGSLYGPVPSWYYGYPGIPIINNPIQVQPPIIINNIIQAPQAPHVPERPMAVPAEFGPAPQPMAPPPAPMPMAIVPPPPAMPEPPAKAVLALPEADRLAEAARKAFSAGQYGRARELFQAAAEIMPNEPSIYFLISQVEFALGKYREAVSTIESGMALRADWSDARYVARDLYWQNPKLFDEHIKPLRQAIESFPNDAGLMFLLGHELWFDGKREEAKALVLNARKLGKGPAEKFGVQ